MKNVLVYMTLIVSLRAARIPGIMNSFYLLHTGLRIGEALALEWCDLDFKHEKLRVYKTLKQSYKNIMIRKEMNFLKGILLFRLQHQRKVPAIERFH